MLKAYGIYKMVRNAAWQTLIDNDITALPVDVSAIGNNNGICITKNSEVNELRDGEVGVSIFDGENWYIVYDDTLNNVGRKRFTIAHELGHIFLGHPLFSGYHARSIGTNKPRTENEADMFAARLLAPACVLWGLGLRTADEIASVCKLSMQAAEIRAQRMEELYRRNVFLTSPLEKQLYSQFDDYIKQPAVKASQNERLVDYGFVW